MVLISGDAVATAASLVGTILVLNVFGATLALYPRPKQPGEERGLLKQSGIQTAAKMASHIFLPCFIAVAVAQTEDIFTIWPLIFWHAVSIPISVLVTWALARACRLPSDDVMPFVATCSWGNMAAVTLVFMQAACDQPALAGEPDCYERASGFIGISVLSWHLTFWTIGDLCSISTLTLLRLLNRTIGDLLLTRGAGSEERVTVRHVLSRLRHPNIVGLLIGMFIAMVPDMSDVFFSEENVAADGRVTHSRPPLGFLASATKTLGTAAVGVITLVVAATLGKRVGKMTPPSWAVKASRLVRSGCTAISRSMPQFGRNSTPEPDGSTRDRHNEGQDERRRMDAGSAMDSSDTESQPLTLMAPHELTSSTMTEQSFASGRTAHSEPALEARGPDAAARVEKEMDEVLLDEAEQGAAGQQIDGLRSVRSLPVVATAMHGSESSERYGSDAQILADGLSNHVELSPSRLPKGRIALMVFGRVVLVGSMQFMLVYLLGSRVFTGPDAPLVQFVLYIQAFTPTANMAVVSCQRVGNRNAAEMIAVAMIFQWLVIGVVLIFSGAVALSIAYPD